MVSNADDIRKPVFETLSQGYEVVGGDGQQLSIFESDELALGSMDQTLRVASGTAEPEPGSAEAGALVAKGAETAKAGGTDYRRYLLELAHQSVVDPEARRTVANILQALLDAVDPDFGGDLQMIDIRIDLTAASKAVSELGERVQRSDATWREAELDF